MSLSQALATSVSGLRTTQAGLSLVAANVANAQTPGYVRKSLIQQASASGDSAVGVRVASITREFDQYVQRQLRVETSGGAYADTRAQFYQRLQSVYGTPGAPSSLETIFNDFTTALQALATSPETTPARNAVLASAQVLAQQLNSMTTDIQALRGDAERGLSEAVIAANEAMRQIASINGQLSTMTAADAAAASLQDQRDVFIDQLAELMDIKIVLNEQNQVNVFTNSGVQLVGTRAAHLTFNPQGTMSAQAHWDADPSKSSVGSLLMMLPSGGMVDLIANDAIRSGKIAAMIEMRDKILVEAQSQLDEIASAMSRALSDKTVPGGAITSGAQNGFSLDTSALLDGNTMTITYTDGGTPRRVTLVKVDDPSVLPLKNSFTNDPNDTVIGVNLAGGIAAVVSQLNAQFNGKLQFSNSGNVLSVLDDGAANNINIASFDAKQTLTSLTGGSAELPFFTDTHVPFTGALTAVGRQAVGFAGRITVNAALLADPSKLVLFSGSTAGGDSTRPDFIYKQLSNSVLEFSPASGIGATGAPFSGSLPSFMRQMLSQQGGAAEAAGKLADGQDVVVSALKARMAEGSSVNIDKEMANLLTLQAAYGANARVMSAIRDMLDTLMKI